MARPVDPARREADRRARRRRSAVWGGLLLLLAPSVFLVPRAQGLAGAGAALLLAGLGSVFLAYAATDRAWHHVDRTPEEQARLLRRARRQRIAVQWMAVLAGTAAYCVFFYRSLSPFTLPRIVLCALIAVGLGVSFDVGEWTRRLPGAPGEEARPDLRASTAQRWPLWRRFTMFVTGVALVWLGLSARQHAGPYYDPIGAAIAWLIATGVGVILLVTAMTTARGWRRRGAS